MLPLIVSLEALLPNIEVELFVATMAEYFRHPFRTIGKKFYCHSTSITANASLIDVATLPYDKAVIGFLEKEKEHGREIILLASKQSWIAPLIRSHLTVFSDLSYYEDKPDEMLEKSYGYKKFDFLDRKKNPAILLMANQYFLMVNNMDKEGGNQEGFISVLGNGSPQKIPLWKKALRVHQWMKNLLLFVPLITSHEFLNFELLWKGGLAFLAFGLCASSVYLLNDLIDLQDDRHHPSKRFRPLASGSLSLKAAISAIPILLLIAFIIATIISDGFAAILGFYYLLTLAYSLLLKRYIAIDVVTLAMLYTFRLIAGVFVFDQQLTFWLLGFSMFIFFSLALAKRYTELRDARIKGKTEKARGRGYYPSDLEMISSLGAASGYISVLVFALYIDGDAARQLYRNPQLLWLSCPLLLFWITRIWFITHRGNMQDDPVAFALKDRVSWVVGAIFGVFFLFAI